MVSAVATGTLQSVAGGSYYKGIVNAVCLVCGFSVSRKLWRECYLFFLSLDKENGSFLLAGAQSYVGLVSRASADVGATTRVKGGTTSVGVAAGALGSVAAVAGETWTHGCPR